MIHIQNKIATPQTMWNLNTCSSHFSSEHLLSWWLWEIKPGFCSFSCSVSRVTSLKEHPLIPLRYFPGVSLLAPVTWLRSVGFLCCSVASTSHSNEVRALSSTSSYSFSWANLVLSPSPSTSSLNNHTCCAEFHLPVQISQRSLSLQLVFLFHLFKPWNVLIHQSQCHIHGPCMDLQTGCGTSSLSEEGKSGASFRHILMVKFSSCMLHFFKKRCKTYTFCVLSVTLSWNQDSLPFPQAMFSHSARLGVHPEEPALKMGKT